MKTLHLTNPLTRGPKVLMVQQLLVKKGFHVACDSVFGPELGAAIVRAKKALKYPAAERKPVAGDRFVERLRTYTPPKPRKKPVRATKAQRQRAAVVAYWRWGIEHEPQIHYAQVRPFPIKAPKKLPLRTDCSGFYSLGLKVAGAPDPNREHWNGTGYTGTLLQHGRKITKVQARPADAVVFGPFPGHHVCGVLSRLPDGDLLLMSHGQERGPMEIKLSEEQKFQPYPATFIDFIGD